ncbi:MAG TPA: uroporphyrinogen-III C-methyltransferase [Chitinophagaceae bacterium]|nr:uroporphyrinogen-III C-methyltransferase [Chitinophagaceae bacterium]
MKSELRGKVFFIGAGPGDPSLLTIKAAEILKKAEVVLADRLVNSEIINQYGNSSALVIPVGKQGGAAASKPQEEINTLLYKMAKRFQTVVRLKGGDVSVFSNILDELETLRSRNIPYEIIPGISAVSGAAAYAGIPLTARNYSTGVRILTYYQTAAISSEAWKDMARFEDTLVFYMSGSTLHNIVYKLVEAGADPSIPFAVIEQATTPHQCVHAFTLEDYLLKNYDIAFTSPSLVIMGKVAALHKNFAWLPNSAERRPFFTPLQNDTDITALLNFYQNQPNVSRT